MKNNGEQIMEQDQVLLPPLVHEQPFVSRQSLVIDFYNRLDKLDQSTVEDLGRFSLGIMGYFQESAHCSWDGWQDEGFRCMSSIYRLIADIERTLKYEDAPEEIESKDRHLDFIKKNPNWRSWDHLQQLDMFEQQYYDQQKELRNESS